MVRNYLDNSKSHRGDSALYSDKLDQRLGSLRMYTLILFFIVGGYIAVAFNISYIGLVCLFFFYIVRGFATPILKGYINQITSPKCEQPYFPSATSLFGLCSQPWPRLSVGYTTCILFLSPCKPQPLSFLYPDYYS